MASFIIVGTGLQSSACISLHHFSIRGLDNIAKRIADSAIQGAVGMVVVGGVACMRKMARRFCVI